jgi:hypothetical protein
MDTASSLSTYRPAIGDSAIVAPSARPVSETDAPRPRRSRAKQLTFVNRSTRIGKRIAQLTALFEGAVAGEISPLRKLKIDKAAELTALSEQARGGFMRDGSGNLENILLAERRAAAACRAVGISVF